MTCLVQHFIESVRPLFWWIKLALTTLHKDLKLEICCRLGLISWTRDMRYHCVCETFLSPGNIPCQCLEPRLLWLSVRFWDQSDLALKVDPLLSVPLLWASYERVVGLQTSMHIAGKHTSQNLWWRVTELMELRSQIRNLRSCNRLQPIAKARGRSVVWLNAERPSKESWWKSASLYVKCFQVNPLTWNDVDWALERLCFDFYIFLRPWIIGLIFLKNFKLYL